MKDHTASVNAEYTPPPSIPLWLLKLFPIIGFLSGLLMWLIDVAIDVYFIHPDERFLDDIFSSEPTEMWMRCLVVLVMTVSAILAQRLLYQQKKTEILLRDYQLHLEDLVAQRTSELEEIANLDPLTRIYNRRKFSEILSYETARSQRYHQPLSLIMCDIDHFKKVNDQYGHEVGDQVLVRFVNSIKSCLRKIDVYARWGGEEFIVLLPQTRLDEAKVVAENLRQCIAAIKTELDFQLTCSFGVTQLHADEDVLPLIKRADDALYQAKHASRNCVFVIE